MLLFAESVEQAKLVLLLFWGSRGNGESPDSIPEHLAPILIRLGFVEPGWYLTPFIAHLLLLTNNSLVSSA